MSFQARNQWRLTAFIAISLAAMLMAPALADARCKLYQHRAKFETKAFGEDLGYLYIRKTVCFNDAPDSTSLLPKITRVSRLEVEHQVVGGPNVSWSGLSGSPAHKYVTNRGRRKGAHYSRAAGHFKQQFLGGKIEREFYVRVSMKVFADGSVDKAEKNFR